MYLILLLIASFTLSITATDSFESWYCMDCNRHISQELQTCDLAHPQSLFYDNNKFFQISTAPSPPPTIQIPPLQPPPALQISPSPPPRPELKRSCSEKSKNNMSGEPKRPENRFFLYKQAHLNDPEYHKLPMAKRVADIAKRWHSEPEEVKQKFEQEQDAVSAQFKADNPGYKYSPGKKKKNPRKRK